MLQKINNSEQELKQGANSVGLRWIRTTLPYLDVIFKSRTQAHQGWGDGRMREWEDGMMGGHWVDSDREKLRAKESQFYIAILPGTIASPRPRTPSTT